DEPAPRVIPIRARKFEFSPAELELKLGEPVVLELTTEDVHMGFDAPALGLHADILPGRVARVPFTPDKPGSFEFACDVFCGSGVAPRDPPQRLLDVAARQSTGGDRRGR